tara:strand:- start:136 stop:906 length:771 start_codon:yes stop_codon:yes gene_type:complete
MYQGKFVDYYDKIFSKKEYQKETEYIFDACELYSESKIHNVLDFGCGTGNHATILTKDRNIQVTGYDISREMIEIAKLKKFENNCCDFFHDRKKLLLDKTKYDLVISMFYVVNHLLTIEEVENFIKVARLKLNDDGMLIFDCWNGISVLKDPPNSSKRERFSEGNIKIETVCLANTDLLNSKVEMKNNVKVFKDDVVTSEFDYNLTHTVWTPFVLKELLRKNNFEVIKVNKAYDLNKEATERDYKIVFICKYRGEI